ncbi:uncharacterized protein LOC106472790 isoform X2 [Limulus polyphemus]|uniref:Uncharacterized protein LOC106472790 isoform X2 n=1 Tax=Limulus polyphemus TaxID=6850 RepID=A0ABM1TMC5_LIMPO|nr:uncharacterized protein LOC106472790 isoform X2 [Limulus polyphemus]
MIHKKSEHRLTYRWLPSETSYQIWKENWKYRTSRRQREFQHEPFEWNEESCDCDEFEESNSPLPPSRLQLKHLQLLGRAQREGHNKLPTCDKSVQTSESCGETRDCQFLSPEKGVQTSLNNFEHLENTQELPEQKELSHQATSGTSPTRVCQFLSSEKGVQTSLNNFEHLENTQELPEQKELSHQATSGSEKPKAKDRPVTAGNRKGRPKSPFAPYGWADNCPEIHPSAVRAKRQIELLNSTSIQPGIVTLPSYEVEDTAELPQKIPAMFKDQPKHFPQKLHNVPAGKTRTSNFGSVQFVRDNLFPVVSNSSAVFIKLAPDQKWLTEYKKKF